MNEKHQEIMREYNFRLKRSEEYYAKFKQSIRNARKAFKQEIPPDISSASSNEYLLVGNEEDGARTDASCSKMMLPMFTAIAKKMVENTTAVPPRYEWEANVRDRLQTARALERELAKSYTKMNTGSKLPLLINHYVVSGMLVQQTIFRKLEEKVRVFKDGRPQIESIYSGGAIDFLVYDPLMCYFDWDADISDMRRTSKFCIVTLSDSMTKDELVKKYGEKFQRMNPGQGSNALQDSLKQELRTQSGTLKPVEGYAVREYYVAEEGKFYVVIADSIIVSEGYNSNGVIGEIPINICPSFVDLDNNCGDLLWNLVKWPVAAMSNAFNQVADNSAFNNVAPMFTLGDVMMDGNFDIVDGRKVYSLNALNKGIVRAEDAITQFALPEVTQGAIFMFDKGKEALFYVTGTSDMAFGIQDKQIRNEQVASMIGNSLIRPDSDLALKLEHGFLNPVTWDILRIFYTRYDDFDFDEELVPKDFLKDYKGIRVVNGSYLASDKAVRLGKLMEALELAKLDPSRAKLEELFYDLYEAIGFIDPYRYLKSAEQAMAEEYMGMIQQAVQMGIIGKEKATAMIQAFQMVIENSEKFEPEAGK